MVEFFMRRDFHVRKLINFMKYEKIIKRHFMILKETGDFHVSDKKILSKQK